jgi:hypothetical protein
MGMSPECLALVIGLVIGTRLYFVTSWLAGGSGARQRNDEAKTGRPTNMLLYKAALRPEATLSMNSILCASLTTPIVLPLSLLIQ